MEARTPQDLETPQGRVALVGMASTFTPISVAADPAGIVPGRAGIDALRTTQWVLVYPRHHERPRKASQQPLLSLDPRISGTPKQLGLLGIHYKRSDDLDWRYDTKPSQDGWVRDSG